MSPWYYVDKGKLIFVILAGAGLSICNTTMMQCCNDSYINSVRLTARLFLEDGLRSQIRDLANRILEITNPVILCKLK